MNKMQKEFYEAYSELIKANRTKEEYEVEYMLLEAKKIFSAEVGNLGNQQARDAKVKKLLEKEYRKLVNLRTDSKEAYYKWATLKTLIESGGDK